MKEYDAYLFDADGTLIDTRELICRSFAHMGETMGVEMPCRDYIESTIGLPVRTQTRDLLGPDREDEFYERAIKAYSDYMMDVYRDYLAAFPGVVDGLAELAERGKKLAVVTSRRRNSLELFMDTLGLSRFFSVVVTADDTATHKPDPEPAKLALKLLDADPAGAVFVGDAEFDVLCGKGAGTDAAFVVWGGMDHTQWKTQPDFVAESFGDLLPGR